MQLLPTGGSVTHSQEGGGRALKSAGKDVVTLPGKEGIGDRLVTLVPYAYPKQWFSTYLIL